MTCPDCNEGKVMLVPFKPFAAYPDDYNAYEADCDTCEGTGTIGEEDTDEKA